MNIDRLEVSYGKYWDPQLGRFEATMSPEVAAAVNAAGQAYSVLLAVAGVPVAAIEPRRGSSWEVYLFDEQGRRSQCIDLGPGPGNLLEVTRKTRLRYATATQHELDEAATWEIRTVSDDGRVMVDPEPNVPVIRPRPSAGPPWYEEGPLHDGPIAAPTFGDWRALAVLLTEQGHVLAPTLELRDAPVPEDRVTGPLRPANIEELFAAGTRHHADGEEVVADVVAAGRLRLPSGRLVTADPGFLEGAKPFTVAVPPGEYMVTLSVLRRVDDGTPEATAAARITITDEPVSVWELALRPGEDPALLADGEFYGFGVDTGTGCFHDASASGLDRLSKEWYDDGADGLVTELTDPASGANLLAFHTGWGDGSYPVWIGRSADGEVACFVADMLIFSNNEDDEATG